MFKYIYTNASLIIIIIYTIFRFILYFEEISSLYFVRKQMYAFSLFSIYFDGRGSQVWSLNDEDQSVNFWINDLLLKAMPALLTSTSRPPYFSVKKSRAERTLSGSVMSSRWKSGASPSFLRLSTAAVPRPTSRAVRYTSPAKSLHIARTIANPMPLFPPVTRATLLLLIAAMCLQWTRNWK